jgi:hypothetical protein
MSYPAPLHRGNMEDRSMLTARVPMRRRAKWPLAEVLTGLRVSALCSLTYILCEQMDQLTPRLD